MDGITVPEDYPLNTVSYSSLREMEFCPLRWKYKYLDGIETPQSAAMLLGWCTHKAIEDYHGGKPDAFDASLATLRERWIGGQEALAKASGQMQRMFNAYTAGYAPEARIIEKRYEVDLTPSVRLVCVVDLVEDVAVSDVKTSTGKDFEPDWLQLGINAICLRENGEVVERAEVRRLRKDIKGGRVPILQVFDRPITDEFLDECKAEVTRRLANICARIRTDMWVGVPPDENGQKKLCAFACSVEHCDWRYAR